MEKIITHNKIPAMTPVKVHGYLTQLGMLWDGRGVCVELGCWLGATSVPLLEGLKLQGYRKIYYAYDRWKVTKQQVKKAKQDKVNLKEGQNSSEIYLQNVSKIYDNIKIYKGEITETLYKYPGDEIYVCLLDAPKKNPVFDFVIRRLLPHFIPGYTVLGLLDYYSYEGKIGQAREELKAPVRLIEENKENFTLIKNWPGECSCAFFRYEKEI